MKRDEFSACRDCDDTGCALAASGYGAARVIAARRLRTELDQALMEMQSGLFNLARNRLNRVAKENPGEAEVLFHLGRCEAARGNLDLAITFWERIPPDSTWSAPAAFEWAQAAVPLGRLTEAERILRAALNRRSPQLPGLLHLLLIVMGQQARIDDARRYIETFWQDTVMLPADDVADRLGLLREYLALEFEPFPLEYYVSQLESFSALASDADQRVRSLAACSLGDTRGPLRRREDQAGLVPSAGRTTGRCGNRSSSGR